MVAAVHATPPAAAPIVWVQAGHEGPREPGYRAQTGAGSGPFGTEVGFTTRLASRVVVRLRAAGVDARRTPGRVAPLGSRGAVFISLHHDAEGGRAGIGHAITGAGENWYHGEGFGTPSPRPYADSAPHRAPTTVTAAVERRSRDLANRLAATIGPLRARSEGADGAFGGVEARDGNVRMMRFYGFYRTRAAARVLLEAGAPGVDDGFLRRVDPIAVAVSAAITRHLRGRGLLR
ncbi:MAG: hypothetical protein JHC74_12865 [Thermoleophilia bacterium]|nr:hypothetical protein [Thermoleophilia bacterium]